MLGTAASAVTAWGLRGGTPAEGRAAAAFGAAAAVNAGIFGYTMLQIMPINKRLLPEGRVEQAEGEDGIMWLLKKASRAVLRCVVLRCAGRRCEGGGRACRCRRPGCHCSLGIVDE